MAKTPYKSLTVAWDDYEHGLRADAAADDDVVDENFIGLQKVMFYRGSALTLEILNRAGVINEDTMPVVATLAKEIRDVHIKFPTDEDVH